LNFQRSKLNQAVVAAIVSMTAGHAGADQSVIEEVVVTATKRSASMQDIPIAVQAMTENTLEEQNVTSFEDYVKYLPSVSSGGRGPGQNEIYIRGAAVDAINISVAESQGSAPNVALYLDEQPVTAGGRNLDVYVTDMERIEVLPGPQGTLYGASSQAGTVRLITNKPVVDEFAASLAAGVSSTSGGEPSDKVEAMINIPVIEGKLAVRAAVYSDNRGGYIDNVEGTFTANPDLNTTFPSRDGVEFAEGYKFANGTEVGAGGVTIPVVYASASSSGLVEDDFNDVSYQGVRLGAKYLINDEWSALVQFTQQSLKTQGVFDYDEAIGDLKVSRFTEDSLEDEFSQFAWTLEGRVGALDVLYTGAYLDREVSQRLDYTGYTNIGASISGYQCEYITGVGYHGDTDIAPSYSFDPTISGNTGVIECGNPANNFNAENENTRMTHEVRVSTDPDNALRFTGGVFYEDSEILHIGNFNYLGPAEAGFAPIDINLNSSLDGAAANARGSVDPATHFRNDNHRNEEQFAVFGEVSYDLTENLTIAGSARYYDLEYGFTGYGAWRYGNRPLFVDDADPANDVRPNVTGGRDYGQKFNVLQPLSTDDTITKFTVTWTPTEDLLLYVTSSEGYRPPGFNRGAAQKGTYTPGTECAPVDANPANGFPGYCLPYKFDSDTLENLELGWKMTLLDGQMRLNGSIYQIDWEDIQVSQFDSQNISIFTIVDNGGDAEINGIEMDMVWAINDNLSLFGAMSYNETELVRVDPGFSFVVQDQGRPLPLTPEFQGNLRARYYWDMSGGKEGYWQIGGKYSDEALNSIVDTATEPNTMQDSYVIMDAAVGLTTDTGWGVELYVENLTDERAQLHINRQDFLERTTTNRPRTIGMRFKYDFNE
jgi:outer membrane receptor protein involved in Fe transport